MQTCGGISFKDRYRFAFARRSACRDADNDAPHHLASQGASPRGEAAKRRGIETDRSRRFAPLCLPVCGERHPSPPCFARSLPPRGSREKTENLTDLSRLAVARHSPQRGKQGTAAFLPIKKSSPRKLRIRGEGKSRDYFVTFTFCSRCSASL